MIGYHGRHEYLGKAAARLDNLAQLGARPGDGRPAAGGGRHPGGCPWPGAGGILRRDGGAHRESQRRAADGGDGRLAGGAAGEAGALPAGRRRGHRLVPETIGRAWWLACAAMYGAALLTLWWLWTRGWSDDSSDRIHGGPDLEELQRLGLGALDLDRLLDFSVNVSPYGRLPALEQAVREARLDRYPDPRGTGARRALAAAWDVPGRAAGAGQRRGRVVVHAGAAVVCGRADAAGGGPDVFRETGGGNPTPVAGGWPAGGRARRMASG